MFWLVGIILLVLLLSLFPLLDKMIQERRTRFRDKWRDRIMKDED